VRSTIGALALRNDVTSAGVEEGRMELDDARRRALAGHL
jgi:hypothetical protein